VPAPLIGLTSYHEMASWGAWQAPAVLLPANYTEQVVAAGGVPVLLPPVPGLAGAAVPRLDGLILTGGGDLDPASYDADPHPRTTRVNPGRDQAELEVAAAALAAGTPMLGICRGMQVLNVLLGGTLCQHLDDGGHTPRPGTFGSHPVQVDPASRLGAILDGQGCGQGLAVFTAHHQAVGDLGAGLVATAWAADGTIEAVEFAPGAGNGHPFMLAVQWHPEAGGDQRLMAALVAAARDYRFAVTGTPSR
jgi:putative glutamine amidotransferase